MIITLAWKDEKNILLELKCTCLGITFAKIQNVLENESASTHHEQKW